VIVVFGSINLDLVAHVARLPRAGETIAGRSFATHAGGKGANQALAARRAGAGVALFGAVGVDAFAEPALALMRSDGVDIGGVAARDAPTGVALIHVDDAGENAITVVAGANALASSSQVPDAMLGPATTLLLQLETPAREGLALARRAQAQGARVVLNPAPIQALDAAWLEVLDVLVANETESAMLASAFGLPAQPRAFVTALASRSSMAACVTLGAQGAVAACRTEVFDVPGLAVEVVDTVGAGDAFVGALAAALDRGFALRAALARAGVASALACTKHGAQDAMPRIDDIEAHAATLESRIVTSTAAAR
jgi:ribokinase